MAIALSDLKDKDRAVRLSHQDGRISWESNFDQAICSEVGYWPQDVISPRKGRPLTMMPANKGSHNLDYVEQYVKRFSMQTEDCRHSGGAFWVYTNKGDSPEVDRNLGSWGFKYKSGRGWWKE